MSLLLSGLAVRAEAVTPAGSAASTGFMTSRALHGSGRRAALVYTVDMESIFLTEYGKHQL